MWLQVNISQLQTAVLATNLMIINELAECINEHYVALRCADDQIQHSVIVNIILSTFDNKQTRQLSHFPRTRLQDSRYNH